MKTLFTILFASMLLSASAQNKRKDTMSVLLYSPLKKKSEWRKQSKDTLKVKQTDTVFVGLFYYPEQSYYYAVYQLFSKNRRKWQTLKVPFNPNAVHLPVQMFYVVTDSTITDPSKGIQQPIRTSP